jgi:TM2 domain-containing membrane protein YozV/DNA-directed RNA polymerase subunit RPC12/RpoP
VEVADDDAGLSMSCPTCGRRLSVPGSPRPAPRAGSDSSTSARPRLSAGDAPDKGMVAIQDCPECGKALQLPPEEAGRRVACPRCAHQFVARASGEAPRRDEPRKEFARDDKDENDRPPRDRRSEDDDEDDREDRKRRSGGKYCTECGAALSKRDRHCPECDARQPEARDSTLADASSKKMAAGICALLIGSLGVHKFILGYTTAGVIMLLVSLLTCGIGAAVMHVISIIEGVIYLTKSDEEFHRIYLVEGKEWF